jgi:chromosomal replication initiator protein
MKTDEIWPACLKLCEKELSKQQYSTWVKPLSADIDHQNKTLIILAPNQFVIKWFKERLNENILNFIKGHDLKNLKYKVLKK